MVLKVFNLLTSLDRVRLVNCVFQVRPDYADTQISSVGERLMIREFDLVFGRSDQSSITLRDIRCANIAFHCFQLLIRWVIPQQLAQNQYLDYKQCNTSDQIRLQDMVFSPTDAKVTSSFWTRWFEIGVLALSECRVALGDLAGQWINGFHDRNRVKNIGPDTGSLVSPIHRHPEGWR